MKKLIYGALFLAAVGVGFVSCEKEPFENNENSHQDVKQNSNRALVYNYAIGAETLNQELFRKKFDFNTSLFSSGSSLNNFLYHGVAAYYHDIAVLEKTSATQSTVYYESGSIGFYSGLIKYSGADIVMDEIELLDDNINKLYALRGNTIYKLTYNSASSVFNATIVYTYPTTIKNPRRFSIAPVDTNGNYIRLYTAPSVISMVGQPIAMTTLTYLDINPTNGLTTMPVNVSTQVPGQGNLSSFTANDFSSVPLFNSKHYVVIDKSIYDLNTSTTLVWVNSFANTVRDCSFYVD
jgi:hypothetical protein